MMTSFCQGALCIKIVVRNCKCEKIEKSEEDKESKEPLLAKTFEIGLAHDKQDPKKRPFCLETTF